MKKPEKNWLEWTVFGASAVLVTGVAAWLIWLHFTSARAPALLDVAAAESRRTTAGYDLAVDVVNAGDATAERVRIEVVAPAPGGPERREVEIELVPYRSTRRVWVTLAPTASPAQAAARVLSYQEP